MGDVYSLSCHFYQDLSSTCFTGAASHCLHLSTVPGSALTDLDAPALTVATLGMKKTCYASVNQIADQFHGDQK